MEKRKVERFDLQIETTLNVRDETVKDKLPILFTRDISSAGVFLVTDKPLPIGTSLDLNFLLSQHDLVDTPQYELINISASGRVIRTDGQGMAVEFDKQCEIS